MPRSLGNVERHLRGAEPVGGGHAGVGRGDPCAGVEDDGSPGDLRGIGDLGGEALGDGRRSSRGRPVEHDHELVAAEPAKEVAGSDRRASRPATWVSASSPAPSPSPSFTRLKSSMSNSTIARLPSSAVCRCRSKPARLGRSGQRVVEGLVLEGGERVLQANRHGVERLADGLELAVAVRLDALREIAAAEATDALDQVAERTERGVEQALDQRHVHDRRQGPEEQRQDDDGRARGRRLLSSLLQLGPAHRVEVSDVALGHAEVFPAAVACATSSLAAPANT